MKPSDFNGLFEFYASEVKPLYSDVSADNRLPVEVLFEINAAFDHLSRHWRYGEREEDVVAKSYSHLKRACLDIFKLAVKQAGDEYAELSAIDLGRINGGEFKRRMILGYDEIRRLAGIARAGEGDIRSDGDAIHAFDLWRPAYLACRRFHDDFYASAEVNWSVVGNGRPMAFGAVAGAVFGGIAAMLLLFWLR